MRTIQAVVETSIYANNLGVIEQFYAGILGLPVLGKEAGRHIFFGVGSSNMLLAFNPDTTLHAGMLPAHGARGPGHFALGIPTESLDEWRRHLNENNIDIEKEVAWPRGGRSLYFRDPAGNSVELLTPGVWGLPGGW